MLEENSSSKNKAFLRIKSRAYHSNHTVNTSLEIRVCFHPDVSISSHKDMDINDPPDSLADGKSDSF